MTAVIPPHKTLQPSSSPVSLRGKQSTRRPPQPLTSELLLHYLGLTTLTPAVIRKTFVLNLSQKNIASLPACSAADESAPSLPHWFHQLSHLTTLVLHHNPLHGVLPSIRHLSSTLTTLSLHHCHLTATPYIYELRQLRKLELQYNALAVFPSCVEPQYQHVIEDEQSITHDNLKQYIDSIISHPTLPPPAPLALTALDCSYQSAAMHLQLPSIIAVSCTLQTLNLAAVGVTDEQLPLLRPLYLLHTLNLQHNDIYDVHCLGATLSHLTSLQSLYVQGCQFVETQRRWRDLVIMAAAESLSSIDDKRVLPTEQHMLQVMRIKREQKLQQQQQQQQQAIQAEYAENYQNLQSASALSASPSAVTLPAIDSHRYGYQSQLRTQPQPVVHAQPRLMPAYKPRHVLAPRQSRYDLPLG